MLSESEKLREEIKYYEKELEAWKIDTRIFNGKEKIKELDNKIQELQNKLYDMEFQELVNEENKHNNIHG